MKVVLLPFGVWLIYPCPIRFSLSLVEIYEDDPQVFQDIQKLLAHDWKELQENGVHVDGHHVYPVLIGMKADWSYQVLGGNCLFPSWGP
jgi:hypothetical protein